MSLSDPVSDFLTRMRNAIAARHRYVDVLLSKLNLSILKTLEQQGFVEKSLVNEQRRKVRVYLKYSDRREPVIQGLKRISSPGLRKYVKCTEIPRIVGGMGVAVMSTSGGILDGESARQKKLGGELLCYVW